MVVATDQLRAANCEEIAAEEEEWTLAVRRSLGVGTVRYPLVYILTYTLVKRDGGPQTDAESN